MLRYRPSEIRLSSQDVDDTSKRLTSRRPAATARSTICQLPDTTSTGPRLRRGPERSRDESITHTDASQATQFSASFESAISTTKHVSTSSTAWAPQNSECQQRESYQPRQLLQVDGPTDRTRPPDERYIATSTGTHRGLPVWYNAKVKRDSVMDASFNMTHMRDALDDAIPSIRLPSPTSHSLPALTNPSPVRRVSRSPSLSLVSEHSSRNYSQPPHLRTASTPDLLRPLLGSASAPSTCSRHASGSISAGHSPTTSAAMLELIRQDSSPLERLEQETRSQISRALSARGSSAGAASSRSQSPAFGEMRMPTFESPERPSPHRRRAARYRNAPTFAEIPSAPFSNSFDLLPSFEYSPPSLQPGTFIDRYPGSATTGRRRGSGTGQGATSMPSLPASRPARRRNSGHSHAPVQVPRNTHLSNTNPWSRMRGGSEDAMESRRNTVGGQQRLRRYRSISARVLPPWQDEQENSGRAERMAVMAEIQERRRYVEQTNNGRLDRTPPSLGRFESTFFQN